MSHTVRPHKTYPCAPGDLYCFPLDYRPFLTGLSETAGDDYSGLDTLLSTIIHRSGDLPKRNDYHSTIYWNRYLSYTAISFHAEDLRLVLVHRVDFPPSLVYQETEDAEAPLAKGVRRPDHRYRPWIE